MHNPLYLHALTIREKVLPSDHPDIPSCYNKLGSVLEAKDDLAGAKDYYLRALAIREKVLPPDHPNMGTSYERIGRILKAQGDLAEAKDYYLRALIIFRKKLNETHPKTLKVSESLAILEEKIKATRECNERDLI